MAVVHITTCPTYKDDNKARLSDFHYKKSALRSLQNALLIKKDRYFHIYYDDGRKASDREKLEDKIDRMGRKLKELMGEPVHPAGDYKKYFDLVFWHGGQERYLRISRTLLMMRSS